ncbi:DUF3944 domain-containing protein [Halalkalibacter alkaliphilus]|uniref:DUF3944 domain-containing protein n=1 Tax=Halalkalibacter alkaliphilus TaxID=2917993 RepID=A0A9X2CW77_9BACI|nr:DUF3944 domain-containing protein [Halalkalibacter alkaliphilus]MCL7749207.1 DUF3944 domain-containing protein [Halalkalibacter alkaliphilus]
MAYRQDEDLDFLRKCDNEDLDVLVTYLTKDKSGNPRLTETLTSNEKYKLHYPNHQLYWEEIAESLQLYGANSFSSLFRGRKGVYYEEILKDVCKRLKVNYNKNSSIDTIEMNLLMKVLTDSIEKMDKEQLKEVIETTGINSKTLTAESVIAALQVAIKTGGFTPYKVALIVANSVSKFITGKGLSLTANATLTKVLAKFAGPIGWVITGVWTAIDLAGPAYRVTVPAVIQIAYMRAKMKA